MKSLVLVSFFILTITCANTTQSISEVKIGKQVWMTENLNVDKFRNGDLIPEAKTDREWKIADKKKQPAYCYYENDPGKYAKYGLLYNWYAVIDPRGLAPIGWHIPSDTEWTQLTDFLGGLDVAGKKMKNTSGWMFDGDGTNESGFSAISTGYRLSGGHVDNFDGCAGSECRSGNWWSSTEFSRNNAWGRAIVYSNSRKGAFSIMNRPNFYKGHGFSVRCVKD